MKFNIVSMEDCLEVIIDYRGKTPNKSEEGIMTLSAKSVKNNYIDYSQCYYISEDEYKKFMVRGLPRKGDILLTTEAPLGMVAKLDRDDIAIAQRLLTLRGKDGVLDNDYLRYYLQSPIGQSSLKMRETGTTVTGIKQKEFRKMEIKIPAYNIQKKVSSILNSIDDKIKLNNVINNNLEQQVSILYQSWFEDFKITNGVCPEDWSYQELSSIADIASGKRPPVKSNVCNQETPISIVGAASVMGFTSEANHTDKILVTGRVGTHGVVQRFNTPCWTSDNTLVITSPYYEFTNQILHRIDYSSMNRGSTQPLITQGDMKKVVVLVPDENTLAKFEEFAGSLMVKWEANNKENVKLALLRDTLLPKLMSGELDVSNIDI